MTLIELVVVMVLVGILVAIGVPSYHSITYSSRTAAESNALLGDLQYARAEAAREGQSVTVCISSNGTSCDSASTAWQEGWIVFSDIKADQTVDPGDTVLRVQPKFSSGDTFQSGNNDYAVTFTREGFANLGATGLTITLRTTPVNTYYSTCLNLTQVGSMSIQTHSNEATCQ